MFNFLKVVLVLDIPVVLIEWITAWSVCPSKPLDALPAVMLVPVITDYADVVTFPI